MTWHWSSSSCDLCELVTSAGGGSCFVAGTGYWLVSKSRSQGLKRESLASDWSMTPQYRTVIGWAGPIGACHHHHWPGWGRVSLCVTNLQLFVDFIDYFSWKTVGMDTLYSKISDRKTNPSFTHITCIVIQYFSYFPNPSSPFCHRVYKSQIFVEICFISDCRHWDDVRNAGLAFLSSLSSHWLTVELKPSDWSS